MRHFIGAFGGYLTHRNLLRVVRRTYLSNAFACDQIWDSRLDGKILRKVNSESMYHELNSAYNRTSKIAAVDVDVFVNVQTDDSYLTEVEEFVHKLRLTEETGVTLPTTHHAFIRLFLKCKKYDDLIRILHDRLNYGIFPDYYCTMLLLDHFLKSADLRNAAKVAVLDMYQEDYTHQVVKYMSLLAIHKYLLTDQLWDDPLPPLAADENVEEEEEIKVRVPFLRNPYFDDHFDLIDRDHVCGKSLVIIGSTLENPSTSRSYKLMGLALYGKWNKLFDELKPENSSEPKLYVDAVEFICKFLENKLAVGCSRFKLNKLLMLLNQIDVNSCNEKSLIDTVESELKMVVEKHEQNEIQIQQKLYKDWEEVREERLAKYLDEMTRRNRLQEVERKKHEMKEKEELLYFFDNVEKIEQTVRKKENILSIRQKWKKDEENDEEYVPPEVHKRMNSSDNTT